MNPAELLRKHKLRPKKEWGQNFLGDDRILEDLAELSGAGPGDWVVELGAGLGHFTRKLAETGAHVVAVERDRELAPILREELPGVEIVEADAKSFDLKAVALRAGRPVVLCGNLPYHLSSPILFGEPSEWIALLFNALALDGIEDGAGQVIAIDVHLGDEVLGTTLDEFEGQGIVFQSGQDNDGNDESLRLGFVEGVLAKAVGQGQVEQHSVNIARDEALQARG